MDITFLVVALILVGLVAYMAYAKSQRDQRTFDSLYKPADERLLGDENMLGVSGSIAFEGDTAFTTQPFELPIGAYKLMYWFPQAVTVKIELFSAGGTDSEILGIKSGEGEVGFSVAATGRYFFTIEPTKDEAWEIEIIRLGLPSSG